MNNQTVCEKTAPLSAKSKSAPKLNPDASQITIKEFLTVLTAAYQVHESVEGVLMEGGKTEALNWLRMKENGGKNTYCQTSKTNLPSEEETNPEIDVDKPTTDNSNTEVRKSKSVNFDIEPVKNKLHVVLSEGLLDSVLPYLVENTPQRKPKNGVSSSSSLPSFTISDKPLEKTKRKSVESLTKTCSDVEIHVCDEVKNQKKTFLCNKLLLTSKMGYFAHITTDQRLEDMDISVHCDIGIFEWLMQWVKRDQLLEADWPTLDPHCVIPILVSASFLQMEPLLHDCLLYCHEHLNDILKTSSNLSCLNDSVVGRLAAMYTNSEVEMIKDKKDKIQSKIYTKLIVSLCEPEPEIVRGHWYSLAKIYKCAKCHQLIYPDFATQIPCSPECMRLQWNGNITSLHVRDPNWNLNDYIKVLFKILKTWRRVYWRLWANTHFLYCLICKRYFPMNQMGWCIYHPDPAQFFTLDAQKAPLPVGRYPCCGERAYRFDLLPNFSGCQFRNHVPCTQDVKDAGVMGMLERFDHLIEQEPPKLLFPEKITRLATAKDPASPTDKSSKPPSVKDAFWWDGFEIVPPRPRLGLVSKFAARSNQNQTTTQLYLQPVQTSAPQSEDTSSDEDSSENESCSSSTSSERTEGSGESNPPTKVGLMKNQEVPGKFQPIRSPRFKPATQPRRRLKKKAGTSKVWQHNVSARTNQDNQRSYEETAAKEMATILEKRTTNMSDVVVKISKAGYKSMNSPGGLWVKLEGEWKETLCSKSVNLKNIFAQKLRSRKLPHPQL
ncbi:SANT and BTB domain regulator of class switch recombination isoform X2 [Aethina tumida]|uniref:SANT and BTB domain regulator of class switch recombination isoform X2 n=1 Tax=Aethina tumida TaxID=116153 RepID=UPI00214738D7|nr:SANT and BTB domain regulator of class switch recombination isoform X2 [Aethina tumida]